MAEERRDGYRLAAVRDARSRDEQGRRGELAVAVGDARAAHARLAAARTHTQLARDALAAAVGARDELMTAGATPAQLVLAERFVAHRRAAVAASVGEELRAEAAHDAHQGTIDLRRRTLARARADREVIDRHFERWRLARQKLADRRDD